MKQLINIENYPKTIKNKYCKWRNMLIFKMTTLSHKQLYKCRDVYASIMYSFSTATNVQLNSWWRKGFKEKKKLIKQICFIFKINNDCRGNELQIPKFLMVRNEWSMTSDNRSISFAY